MVVFPEVERVKEALLILSLLRVMAPNEIPKVPVPRIEILELAALKVPEEVAPEPNSMVLAVPEQL